ncbi:MAG: cupin-like domain-containing protein [Moorea sp. SIO2I5]|nr:cupin-like domain-containing protein [Moorena sp. SIO2I5]
MKSVQYNKKCKLVYTPVDSVDRRSNLSYEEFVQEYVSVGKPVIITDVVKNWKASTKWNIDFFRSKYGSVKVKVQDYNPEGEFTRSERTFESMKIADYIDYMAGDTANKFLYLRDLCLYDHPELWEDCEEPMYFNNWFTKKLPFELLKKLFRDNGVFIGYKNTSIGLHYDMHYKITWIAIISGQKKAILLSPDQGKYLYDGRVNCFKPNLEKFPLYAKAKPVECIIKQGEMLLIPPNWWHQLKNLENTIALVTSTINEWNYELYYQDLVEKFPVRGHLFPLMWKFPWLFRVLVSIGTKKP